jgi:hypothetical protein
MLRQSAACCVDQLRTQPISRTLPIRGTRQNASTDHRRQSVGRSRGGAEHPNGASVTGTTRRTRTERPSRVLTATSDRRGQIDRWVRLRDGKRGPPSALANARAKYGLLNQMRSATGQPIQGPGLVPAACRRGAAWHVPMVLIGSAGHPGRCFDDISSPALAVRSVNCWDGYGTGLARASCEYPPSWEDTIPTLTCGRSW